MDILRTAVSGKKKRFQEDGYNLDLSYITPRLIAMSFPAEGFSRLFRNSLDSVSKMLNDRHLGNYKILNLTGFNYNYAKFDNQVLDFPWEDHHPPPIELLFQACQSVHEWLCSDINHVLAVHCMAGKGRTGTLLCCYLLYIGRFNDPEQALLYYKRKRFMSGGGVTQPSQVRYVKYFSDIMQKRIRSPFVAQLSRIRVKTAPKVSAGKSRPYIDVYQFGRLIYSSKESNKDRQLVLQDDWEVVKYHEIALINSELLIQGDILCKLYHWGTWKSKKICRFSFNTSFVPSNGVLVLSKRELDPDKFKFSKKVSDKFAVYFIFQPICHCTSQMEMEERCNTCKPLINHAETTKWRNMRNVVENIIPVDPSVQLFRTHELDDVEHILSKIESESDNPSDYSN